MLRFFLIILLIINPLIILDKTEQNINYKKSIDFVKNFNQDSLCLDSLNTTIQAWDVKVVEKLKGADVLITKDSKSKFLGFSLDCDIPRGLIPKIFFADSTKLILIRGTGFHFRETIIITDSVSDSLKIWRYETIIGLNSPDEQFFISENKIFVLDRHEGSIHEISSIQLNENVKRFESRDSKVSVEMEGGSTTLIERKDK